MDAGEIENRGTHDFTAPSEGFGSDWVLIMDNASKGYKGPAVAPGDLTANFLLSKGARTLHFLRPLRVHLVTFASALSS